MIWLYEFFRWMSWIGGYGFLLALVVGGAWLMFSPQFTHNPYGCLGGILFVLPCLALLLVLFLMGVIGRWLS